MLQVLSALQVNRQTIFDVLGQKFFYGDFVYFSKLVNYLSAQGMDSKKDVQKQEIQDFGILSTMLYLSSKIHMELEETAGRSESFRPRVQMPVLIGDLLYGRFLEAVTNTEKTEYLPIYITYLKQYNKKQVDSVMQRENAEQAVRTMALLLTEKTAEVLSAFAEQSEQEKGQLQKAARQYWQEQWDAMRGEVITNLPQLETKLQADGMQ